MSGIGSGRSPITNGLSPGWHCGRVHVILDNYRTHKSTMIRNWLAKRPRFHVHFTPTYGLWISLVERWLAELSNQRISRGVLRSIAELEAAVRDYIDVHNSTPFVWTRAAAIPEK